VFMALLVLFLRGIVRGLVLLLWRIVAKMMGDPLVDRQSNERDTVERNGGHTNEYI